MNKSIRSSTKMKKTQEQMFYDAGSKSGELNNAFMELINHPTNPMTNSDLRELIKRRPEVYGRFSGFIGKLKD